MINTSIFSIYSVSGAPNVAIALKRPLAIRSVSSSISCSEADGEFKSAYDVIGVGMPAVLGVDALGGAGRSEKSDGEGEMKDKY